MDALALAIRRGDASRRDELWGLLAPVVGRLSRNISGSAPTFMDAEDFRQDAFFAFAKSLEKWDPAGGHFLHYVARAVKNELLDLVRRPRQEIPLAELGREDEDGAALLDRLVPGDEDGQAWDIPLMVGEALAQLTPEQREALRLRYVEGLSLREVGARSGISRDAAKSLITRALRSARRLTEHPPAPPKPAPRQDTRFADGPPAGWTSVVESLRGGVQPPPPKQPPRPRARKEAPAAAARVVRYRWHGVEVSFDSVAAAASGSLVALQRLVRQSAHAPRRRRVAFTRSELAGAALRGSPVAGIGKRPPQKRVGPGPERLAETA